LAFSAKNKNGANGQCTKDQTTCSADANCAPGSFCTNGCCIQAKSCADSGPGSVASSCTANQHCEDQDRGAVCVANGCLTAKDCSGTTTSCIAGACTDSSAISSSVASCQITNTGLTVATGATVAVEAAAFDANGTRVPYQSYTVTGGNTAFSLSGTTLTATSTPGTSMVTATFGSTQCSATFTNIGSNAAGQTRLTLVSGAAGLVDPKDPTTIYFTDGSNSVVNATTFAKQQSGVYTAATPSGALTVNVVGAADKNGVKYHNVTVYGISAKNDFVIPLEPIAQVTGFGGAPDFTNYDTNFKNLSTAEIQVAYAGASLPLTSILNFRLSLFAGDLAPVPLSVATFTSGGAGGACKVTPTACYVDGDCTSGSTNICASGSCVAPASPAANCVHSIDCTAANTTCSGNGQCAQKPTATGLPRALYLGLSGSPVGANCAGYGVRGSAGRRTAWSLGGKLKIASAIPLIGAFTGSSGLDLSKLLPAVVPFLDNLAIGSDSFAAGKDTLSNQALTDWRSFVASTPDAQATNTKFAVKNVSPANKLQFTTNFANPGLIDDPVVSGGKMNVIIALIASLSPTYGLAPLGFGFGLDLTNTGKLQPAVANDARFPADKVYARYSSPSANLSDNEIVALVVSTNLSDTLAAKPQSSALRLKGIVARSANPSAQKLGWDNSQTNPSLGSLSGGASFASLTTSNFTASGNTFTTPKISAVGSGTAVVIMRIASDDETDPYWNVIINPANLNGAAISLNGSFSAASKNVLTFATTTLEFSDNAGFSALLDPTNLDLEHRAGLVSSFTVYSDTIKKQ